MITYLEKIKLIELDYFQESYHTLSSNYRFLDGIYSIKKEIIMDSDNSNVSDIDKMRGLQSLEHFEGLIEHQIKQRMNNRAAVLTIIGTIFLTFNFIVI
jgi:Mg2+ and Co2+ transporter CorA